MSMGIGSILNNSKKIIMIAYGKEKQNAINELLKGKEDKN
jgi:6-phosphogluconolactonase/glucosamine-6-phosphate isomerase/deaminase